MAWGDSGGTLGTLGARGDSEGTVETLGVQRDKENRRIYVMATVIRGISGSHN